MALDSNDNLYVVDLGNERVLKFTHSGGTYTFASVIQSGKPAAAVAGQIAVNATTHELYVSDPDADLIRLFSLVTISPPTATTKPATPVGQVAATLTRP